MIAEAINAGTSLLGIGMNMFGQNQQQQNQMALMNQQMNNQMQLNQQGQRIQQENWDYTNYENQVKHMENAGLNVGLMYGMGGGGGQSMGAGGGGGASGGNAPQNNSPQMIGLMQQAAVNQADIDLKNAQRDKLKSETPQGGNIGDTGLANTQADTALKTINAELGSIQKDIQSGAKDYSIMELIAKAEKMQYDARQAFTKANVGEKTMNEEIQTIQTKLAGLGLENVLTKSKTQLTNEQIEAVKQDVANSIRNTNANVRNSITNEQNADTQQWKSGMEKTLRERGLDQEDTRQVIDVMKAILGSAREGTTINKTNVWENQTNYK